MKKLLVILSAAVVLYACGGSDGKATDDKKDTTVQTTPGTSTAAVDEKALELIGSKGCTACHAIDKKLIGPAYIDVSKKYEPTADIIDSLASKVIKGGVGVWGDVPMTANTTVSPDEAKEMVTYILSLKNK